MSRAEFVTIWESHDNLLDIEKAVNKARKAANEEPMSRASIAAKAGQLRNIGVKLSKKKQGPKPAVGGDGESVESLNALIAGLQKKTK